MRHTANLDAATVGAAKVQQALEQGGLARAVHAHQAKKLALPYLQVNAVQHRALAVVLAELGEAEGGCGHSSQGRGWVGS